MFFLILDSYSLINQSLQQSQAYGKNHTVQGSRVILRPCNTSQRFLLRGRTLLRDQGVCRVSEIVDKAKLREDIAPANPLTS